VKMGFNLSLEQTQKLIMTQELQQAIKILQLSSLELKEYIRQQLETNPLIEEKEEDMEPFSGEEGEDMIARLIENISHGDYNSGEYGYSGDSENDFSFENYVPSHTTLKDHLLFQLHITVLPDRQREIGEYIIESLNGNGYLTTDIQEIAEAFNTDDAEIEKVLSVIQTFDPAGVACRDLRECLLLQLDARGIEDPLVREIISNHLGSLGDKSSTRLPRTLTFQPPRSSGCAT